ncbi:MAG: hypothetical protein AB3N20_11095 [Rhizobiaceae bacterium]
MSYFEHLSVFGAFNPLFTTVDSTLSFLPVWARLILWGVLAGLCSMAIYRRISAQGRLNELAAEIQSIRQKLKTLDVSEPAYRGLVTQSLRLGGKRLGISLLPALVSALPVIFLAIWVEANYALSKPEPNSVAAILVDSPDSITINGGQKLAAGWLINWPHEGETLAVTDSGGNLIYEITHQSSPGLAAVPGVMKLLFGANAGALPDGSTVDTLVIETAPRALFAEHVVFPHQWAIPFFMALLLASLGMKFVLRIK